MAGIFHSQHIGWNIFGDNAALLSSSTGRVMLNCNLFAAKGDTILIDCPGAFRFHIGIIFLVNNLTYLC